MLNRIFGYNIHNTARIGFSIILPEILEMEENSKIGHLTVCKGISRLRMHQFSKIGNLNWITTSAKKNHDFLFKHKPDRDPSLIIGEHSSITLRHILDCSDKIEIGSYSTVAGYHSQLLTHSVDIQENRQSCNSILIGDFCFVGTNCTILPGAKLGNYSILGAASLLNKRWEDPFYLYAGVPAKPQKRLDKNLAYFHRENGEVN